LILVTLCRYPGFDRRRFEDGSNGWNRPTPPSPRWRCSSWARPSGTAPRFAKKSLKMDTFQTLETLEATGHLRITPFLSDMSTISRRPAPA
jgi:hypothetical protein